MAFQFKQPSEVPAYSTVETFVASISNEISIDRVGHEFDSFTDRFVLTGTNGRIANLDLSRDLLEDLRDNPSEVSSRYTLELASKLTSKAREAIETNGLLSFADSAMKYALLRFVE